MSEVIYPASLVNDMVEVMNDIAVSTQCHKGIKETHRINGCVLEEVNRILGQLRELHK